MLHGTPAIGASEWKCASCLLDNDDFAATTSHDQDGDYAATATTTIPNATTTASATFKYGAENGATGDQHAVKV